MKKRRITKEKDNLFLEWATTCIQYPAFNASERLIDLHGSYLEFCRDRGYYAPLKNKKFADSLRVVGLRSERTNVGTVFYEVKLLEEKMEKEPGKVENTEKAWDLEETKTSLQVFNDYGSEWSKHVFYSILACLYRDLNVSSFSEESFDRHLICDPDKQSREMIRIIKLCRVKKFAWEEPLKSCAEKILSNGSVLLFSLFSTIEKWIELGARLQKMEKIEVDKLLGSVGVNKISMLHNDNMFSLLYKLRQEEETKLLEEKMEKEPGKVENTEKAWGAGGKERQIDCSQLYSNDKTLHCPCCDSGFLHFVKNWRGPIAEIVFHDHPNVQVSEDNMLAIHFWCEGCNEMSTLGIWHHEGTTVIEWLKRRYS